MNFKGYYQQFLERAYHGSPHKIKAGFDPEKVGTGHGAQAFGWGFYFAENPTVAKDYVPSSFKNKYMYKGKSGINWLNDFTSSGDYVKAGIWENILLHKSKHQILQQLDSDEEDALKYVNSLPEKLFAPLGGFLYTAELDTTKDQLLDWYLTVENQSTYIQKKLEPLEQFVMKGLNYVSNERSSWKDIKGAKVYAGLAECFSIPQESGGLERTKYDLNHKPKSASLMLHSIGIKGIMYDDYLSASEIRKTKNFVIFSSSDIKLIDDSGE